MWWTTGSGRIELQMTKAQAASVSQPGKDAHLDVCALLRDKKIRRQVDRLDRDLVKAELREYGAWDDADMIDHEANLQRLVWLAGCDITEGSLK